MSSKIVSASGETITSSSETEVQVVRAVDKFHKMLVAGGIVITASNEDSLYSNCGVFYISEETGIFGYHANSTLPAELASAVAATFFKIASLLGYADQVVAMAAVYPTNVAHTNFVTDPDQVKELTEKFFAAIYAQKAASESRIVIDTPQINLDMGSLRRGR